MGWMGESPIFEKVEEGRAWWGVKRKQQDAPALCPVLPRVPGIPF